MGAESKCTLTITGNSLRFQRTDQFYEDSEGWIHRSYALVQYNLACYACQLGEIEEARAFLARAIELGDADKVKLMALDDPNLAPLLGAAN